MGSASGIPLLSMHVQCLEHPIRAHIDGPEFLGMGYILDRFSLKIKSLSSETGSRQEIILN